MKMLKRFVRSCVALLNKMLFVDFNVSKLFVDFILAPCYNLTMMMESVFQPFQRDSRDISREILANVSLLLKNFRKLEKKVIVLSIP